MLLFTTAFIVATTLGPVAHGQYYPRPYQMAIQNGFSPYHPARINHETLPISQAEFAQLVAESMATSHGPHHHHPPNTDADYEGPDHARHDAEMLRSASGESHYGYQPNYQPHQQHHHQQHHHAQHHHQAQHHQHHAQHSQYQPDDHYHHDEPEGYHRAPVYEQSRKGSRGPSDHEDRYPPQQQQEQQEEEDDEADGEAVEGVEQYGGRPSTDNYHSTSGYDRSSYMNNYEEDNPREQYMAASEHIPIKIIPLKH